MMLDWCPSRVRTQSPGAESVRSLALRQVGMRADTLQDRLDGLSCRLDSLERVGRHTSGAGRRERPWGRSQDRQRCMQRLV
jgi:hypothetical protein